MQSNTATETDRTAGVEPPIEPSAAWRVRDVQVVVHGVLEVQFVDGTRGTVDLRPRLCHSDIAGTVFEPLRDPDLFARAAVHLGAVEWPGEIDLAPDAMYDEIRAHGQWILD
jgi:Protein of unknown function (DUF2442).